MSSFVRIETFALAIKKRNLLLILFILLSILLNVNPALALSYLFFFL